MSQDLTTYFVTAEPEENTFAVFPKGEYPFTILEINSFEVSRAGNDMLPIKLEFADGSGSTSNVYENLVFTEKALFKINQFLAAIKIPIGTAINFRDPKFIAYLKKQSGRALLGVETYTDKNGKEREKNVVEKFVYEGTSKRETPPAARPAPVVPADDDDSIPF